MRLTTLLAIAAAFLPCPRALADGVALDAPVLPPPGFAQDDAPVLPPPGFAQDHAPASQAASVVHVVPHVTTRIPALVRTLSDEPVGGSANDALVLPPPSFVGRLAAPTAAIAAVEIVRPQVTSIPALAVARPVGAIKNHSINGVVAELPVSPEVVLPALSPEVIVTESPCLAAACAPCQGYPSCGDPASCPRYWFAAAEATFLGIHADSGGRTQLDYDDANFAGTELVFAGGDGHDSFGFAPRISFGYQHNAQWGVVGRFWSLENADDSLPAAPPEAANLDGFAASESTRIKLSCADVEAVRSFTTGLWKLDAAGGVRHASLGIATNLVAAADFAGDNLASSQLANDTSLDGTGLTGALAARRPIAGSSAHAFLSGRSSMLWGSSASRSLVISSVSTTTVVPDTAFEIQRTDSPFAWIGEVQLGVHWEFPLERYPVNAFVRTAAEYQRWAVDADLNSSVTFDAPNNPIRAVSVASAGNGRVDLYGLAIAAGFLW